MNRKKHDYTGAKKGSSEHGVARRESVLLTGCKEPSV
jgi:hypothetical protein